VALAYGDAVLSERMFDAGDRVTFGHAHGCTFVLPAGRGDRADGTRVLLDRQGLHLLDVLAGRIYLKGVAHELEALRAEGRKVLLLEPEDWGVLHLASEPRVRLVVQRIATEPRPRLPADRSAAPVLATTALSALGMGIVLVVALLRYDPGKPRIDDDAVSDRMARVMFSKPPEPPPEEEPEIAKEEQKEEKERKKAGGDEGKFGDPDRRGPSNIPRNPKEVAANTGLVKELNALAESSTMTDLLGVSGQVGQALGGLDDGALVVGAGNFGMSTKGGGMGGGGEGVGTVMGTGDVDVGGSGAANRKKQVAGNKRPAEKKVEVTTGTPTVKGQLSKELIDREVRRHRAQITFCYNKQLLRFPDLSGKVLLSWVIGMDGSVKGAKVKSSSLGNADAESCMVRALESWVFPKPEGGVVQVDYPFIFGTQ
jgi:outer membrane biosynthesis protein TonB